MLPGFPLIMPGPLVGNIFTLGTANAPGTWGYKGADGYHVETGNAASGSRSGTNSAGYDITDFVSIGGELRLFIKDGGTASTAYNGAKPWSHIIVDGVQYNLIAANTVSYSSTFSRLYTDMTNSWATGQVVSFDFAV